MSGRYVLLLVCVAIAGFFITLAVLEAVAYAAPPRHAHHTNTHQRNWICPESPDGSIVFSRSICVLEAR